MEPSMETEVDGQGTGPFWEAGGRGEEVLQGVGQPATCPWGLCPMKDNKVPA